MISFKEDSPSLPKQNTSKALNDKYDIPALSGQRIIFVRSARSINQLKLERKVSIPNLRKSVKVLPKQPVEAKEAPLIEDP